MTTTASAPGPVILMSHADIDAEFEAVASGLAEFLADGPTAALHGFADFDDEGGPVCSICDGAHAVCPLEIDLQYRDEVDEDERRAAAYAF